LGTEAPPQPWSGATIVVVPSLTLSIEDLRNVTGVVFYEERLLCFLLLLADPAARVVYTTSTTIDPAIIDYYLRFLPDPADARRRLTLVDVGDPELGWLTAKLLSDRGALNQLRDAIDDPARARLLPFIATPWSMSWPKRSESPSTVLGPTSACWARRAAPGKWRDGPESGCCPARRISTPSRTSLPPPKLWWTASRRRRRW
jgi:hypothetical protein